MAKKAKHIKKELQIMTYKQKILEVPIQLGLLIVSIIVQLSAFLFLLYGHYLGKFIMEFLFDWLKVGGYNTSYWRYVQEQDIYVNGYYKTKTYNIKDSDGNFIGTCETQGEYVPSDNWHRDAGWELKRKDIVDDMWVIVAMALPLRIISLVLAFFALFIPKLYVSVKTPHCEKMPAIYKDQLKNYDTSKIYGCTQNIYNDDYFLYLDLIILNKDSYIEV